MESTRAKEIMSGHADPLTSTFRLSYNMLLNLMRVEDADPEFVIRKSLRAFQDARSVPELENQCSSLESQLKDWTVQDEEGLAQYDYVLNEVKECENQVQTKVFTEDLIKRFLNVGRLVMLSGGWNWGVLCQLNEVNEKKNGSTVAVVVACNPDFPSEDIPYSSENKLSNSLPRISLCSFSLSSIKLVSSLRVHVKLQGFRSKKKTDLEAIFRNLQEVKRRFPEGIPLLSPKSDLKIEDEETLKVFDDYKDAVSSLNDNSFHSMEDKRQLNDLYIEFCKKNDAQTMLKQLRLKLKRTKELPMKDRFMSMKTVLQRLGHVNRHGVIELKGNVACEINTADELICTEMILNGTFNNLSSPEIAALLSCLIYGESGSKDDSVVLSREMGSLHRNLKQIAKRVAQVQKEAGIDIDPDEYAETFPPDLMNPIFQWCKGAKFAQICDLTDVFEGSIIRCTRRLVELLRELSMVSHIIGDAVLEQKFTKAIELIKRDIIFAASLYL